MDRVEPFTRAGRYVRATRERTTSITGVRPRIYREMNPLRAGWAVRMTGPYTPAISGSVRTMLRVFESTFIYNYLFVDPCITSEPGKIIVNLNISPKKIVFPDHGT
jgi:hypothetical protein